MCYKLRSTRDAHLAWHPATLVGRATFMKNFLRALRVAWGYRGRLILSLACAVLAAGLWGLTFTCIEPVLHLLGNGGKPDNNLQARQESKIEEANKKVQDLEPQIRSLR